MRFVRPKLEKLVSIIKVPFVAVAVGILFGALIIILCGNNVAEVYGIMLHGSFGNAFYVTTTLMCATPVILCGLAVASSWRCGYSNLGLEGQMICGGIVASQVAVIVPGGGVIKILAAVTGGMIAGGLYALVPAWLYRRFNASIIITTLMMNYIAVYLSFYIVQYHALDPNLKDTAAVQTEALPAGARLPKLLAGYDLHLGFVIAIMVVIVFYLIFKHTRFGFQSRLCGLNPAFAVYGGVNTGRLLYETMLLSGVIAGLAGAIEVVGTRFRYIDGMFGSSGYAWTGITAALMANNNPVGVFFSSLLLCGITTGSAAVQRNTTIPLEVALMIQGVITLFITVHALFGRRKPKGGSLNVRGE